VEEGVDEYRLWFAENGKDTAVLHEHNMSSAYFFYKYPFIGSQSAAPASTAVSRDSTTGAQKGRCNSGIHASRMGGGTRGVGWIY